QVARHQIRTEGLAGLAVQEVIVAVVRTLTHLDGPVLVRDDVGLPGPTGPAPVLGLAQALGHHAHAARSRIPPQDDRMLGERTLPVVVAGGVPTECGQAWERPVDGTGRRVRP